MLLALISWKHFATSISVITVFHEFFFFFFFCFLPRNFATWKRDICIKKRVKEENWEGQKKTGKTIRKRREKGGGIKKRKKKNDEEEEKEKERVRGKEKVKRRKWKGERKERRTNIERNYFQNIFFSSSPQTRQ